ncbi:MAG: MFS transporter [Eggerthellaceae bacterium]|nr:MFS transporter [Eggerthellaceae bacterium]
MTEDAKRGPAAAPEEALPARESANPLDPASSQDSTPKQSAPTAQSPAPGQRSAAANLGEIFTRDFLLIATINLAMFFAFQMTTIGLPIYVDALGASTRMVGLVATFMAISATAARIFAGPMLDRFGRSGMLIGGIALSAVTIAAYAIFPIVGVILGIRLLHGIGWGVGSTATSTIAADIIPKPRFAEGMGYYALTAAISSALAPAVSVELVQGAGGPTMLFVSAGITLLALVLAVLRTLLGRAKAKNVTNGQVNCHIPPENVTNDLTNCHSRRKLTLDTVFERRAVLPSVLMLLVNVGFGCVTTFIALHAEAQGVTRVSLYFLVYAVVTLATRPLIGRIIDARGYRTPAILATLCTAGTLVLIGASNTTWMFALAGVFAGLGVGTSMGTFQSMAVAAAEPWRRGVATSTYMTFFDLGIAAGAGLGGIVAGAWGYGAMFAVMAAFPLIASGLSAFLVRE